jgi:hypothetical protein
MGTKGVLRTIAGGNVGFWCPGCKEMHVVSPSIWTFDGNYDAPTFSPSVLITTGHYCPGQQPGAPCWCTYETKHKAGVAGFEMPAPVACTRCHSFVVAGQIRFLGDSTHALAGQTVPLAAMPAEPQP